MNRDKLMKDINYVEDQRIKMGMSTNSWKNDRLYRMMYAILEILYDILHDIRRKDEKENRNK